jgi:HIRAN domain
MKRNEFIKNLILLFGATALPNALQAMVHQYQRIYLLQSFVRGFQYYDGKKLLKKMKVGALLELVREPNNEYDTFAIAIHYQGKKIGFVPAESNEILAKLLDADLLKLQAEITNIEPKSSTWENTAIAIYVLKPNTDALPAQGNYLLNLDEPHYRTLRTGQYFLSYDEKLFDVEEQVIEDEGDHRKAEKLYEILEHKSKTDEIYGGIHHHFTSDQMAVVAKQNRVIINKHKLPKHISVKKIAQVLDKKITDLNDFFDEKGFVIVNIDQLNKLPLQIETVQAVLDKNAKQFMEIVLG